MQAGEDRDDEASWFTQMLRNWLMVAYSLAFVTFVIPTIAELWIMLASNGLLHSPPNEIGLALLLFGMLQPIPLIIAFACLALLVAGLYRFRLKGLWLAIPLAAAAAWPTWFTVWLIACASRPGNPVCLP